MAVNGLVIDAAGSVTAIRRGAEAEDRSEILPATKEQMHRLPIADRADAGALELPPAGQVQIRGRRGSQMCQLHKRCGGIVARDQAMIAALGAHIVSTNKVGRERSGKGN